MDSIAQAAGRCNRNGKSKHGLLYIVNIPNERVEKLHDIYIGQKISDRIMDDFRLNPERYSKNLIGPQSLYDYYQYYFFERSREMEYPISKKDFGHDDTLLNLLSNNHQAVNEYGKINKSKPNILFRQSFMSAAKAFKSIDAPTEGIIVPYGSVGSNLIVELCATKEIDKQYALLKKAQQFTVNVFPHIMSSLIKNQAVRKIRDDVNIMFLDTNYYSDDFGLSTDPIHHIPLEKSHAL
jgi:CRISPR-associated endonuclease/helicase Cas3